MSLPKRIYQLSGESYCVHCRAIVNPSLCRTGKALKGMGWITKTISHLISVDPKVIYGEEEKKVPSIRYERGYICQECEKNYHHFRNLPLVVTDPLPGFVGETVRGHSIKADSFGLRQAPLREASKPFASQERRKCSRCDRPREWHGVNGECPKRGVTR
jgi:hypothetical protein